MGENSEESEVFGVSRELTNWTTAASAEFLDYGDSWSAAFPNGSINGSVEANKTSSADFKRDEELAKVEMAVLALIFILTVLGNCIVLLGIFFRRQKMTRMYYFILHLSVADLITAFFNVLTQLFWEITYRFQGGNVLCKFVKYTQILGPYSSSYVLVMTALDRYQAICYPLSNCSWSAKRTKMMLGLAWTLSLLFSAPQIFIFSYQIVKPATDSAAAEYDCWATFPENWYSSAKAYVTWFSLTVFLLPLVFLVFAYTNITRAIWINFNMKAASRNHDLNERRFTRADSDDGEGPSNHSQDESSVFNREGQLSLRANTSHSISGSAPTKKSNINLYSLSKHSSTSSASGVENCTTKDSSSRKKYRDQGKKSVNNRITTRTSTSSCTTQSSITLSPSLSSRRMSVPDDKGGEHNKNPLCFTSHKMFTSHEDTFNNTTQEEQLQLIHKESERNELGSTSTTDKHDVEANGTNGNGEMKNGGVKFSGASDICQHGCSEKRCNFCHLSPNDHDRRYSNDGTNLGRKDSILNKAMAEKQTSPEREKQPNQIYRFAGKSSARHLLLPTKNRLSKKGKGASFSSSSGGNHEGKQSTKSMMATSYVGQQPRTHSVKGISRAKIKTIKLTVTIICCYIFCSSPFIAAQLWSVYDPYAMDSPFFSGPTFTILTLLASLNSCVNPYIFLFFNPNLLENCFRGIFRPKFPTRRYNGGSPLSRTMSHSKKVQLGVTVGGGSLGAGGGGLRKAVATRTTAGGINGSPPCATSVTHLSPLISREQKYHPVPVNGHLEKLPEKTEIPNAVELVDSSNCSSHTGKYSPLCRVETALVGVGSKNHVSTLIA